MSSRAMEFERRTLLVQFLSVQPLTFFPTSDGTDLVQDILRSQLVRSDAEILGQAGSISLDDQGEFLTFEPTDTKNRTLHLPVEHLAYAGALRRMRPDPSDQRNADQIYRRDFENVDLANRYAQHIIGPPVFVAVFHGFDKALCYTFITQSADDACLAVMKLMRAFQSLEEKLEEEGREQGLPPVSTNRFALPSPVSAPLFANDQGGLIHSSNPFPHSSHPSFSSNMFTTQGPHDDLLQQLLANPNLQVVHQPYQPSSPFVRPADASVQSMFVNPPQMISRRNPQDITYKQNVIVRWIKAPTPPPPAPIIIREIRAAPEVQPPIICRQVPPCPPTPPPIVVREAAPVCPPSGPPVIVERRLPGGCLPRQVIVQRCPAPPPKPRTVIYEKYLPPPPPRPRQVIIQREQCVPSRRLVKEIVRHVPQPAVVCTSDQQQQITAGPSQVVQQLVPVFATRQHVVQPKGIRVIRQVIGPAQGSLYPTAGH